jgi:hypothetical protein
VTIGTQRSDALVSRGYLIKTILLSLAFVLLNVVPVQSRDWRGITPLHSTRTDVERLLGRPSVDRGDTTVYELEFDDVYFDYAMKSCDDQNEWNVPRNTVIKIVVIPIRKPVVFSDLKLDLSKYVRKQNQHLLHFSDYSDATEGIAYEVDESGGEVAHIEYFAAAKDLHLQCRQKQLSLRRDRTGNCFFSKCQRSVSKKRSN